MTGLSGVDELADAHRLVESDPAQALARALEVVRSARAGRQPALRSRAERVAGLASFHLGRVDEAAGHLRAAVGAAVAAADHGLEGLARMSLAGALSFQGRTAAALREMDRALTHLTGADRLTALGQHAMILWNCGRFDEALDGYGTVLREMRDAGDLAGVHTVLLNRGACLLDRLDLQAAEQDLVEAVGVAAGIGDELSAAYARANLGYLYALSGDVPRALEVLGAAEQRLRAASSHVGELLSMRADALLAVRLLREAREVGLEALEALTQEGNRSSAALTRLTVAQVAAIDGRTRPGALAEAATHARRAGREFRRLGRADQVTLARLVELQALAKDPATAGRVRLRDVTRVVEVARAAGWWGPLLDAHLLAHDVAAAQRHRSGPDHLRAASLLRHGRRPADLRARAWYAEALLRRTAGNPAGAERAALRGLEVLDEFRAVLPATDLRAHAAAHRGDLCDLGVQMALDSADARRVLRWAERSRATHVLTRPVTPPRDPVLAERMATLRRAVMDLYDARNEGAASVRGERLRTRVTRLEREIRDLARRSGGPGTEPAARLRESLVRPAAPADLASALGDRALVEYVVHDGALHAVTLVDRRCRLHHLGDVARVAGLVERVPFAVQRMIRAARSPGGAAAAQTLLADAGRRLDALLLEPLRETAGRDLVVVPTGVLQATAWSVLPSCQGRPVTVAPSATVWLAASGRPTAHGPAVVAAGPRLANAAQEARAVADLYGVEPVVDPDATVSAVSAALPGASVAHLATHGRLSADNPLFSHLLLSDGPLVVYDLERLESLPHTVVLAACDSGRHVAPAGDELLGLGAAFLAGGTAQVVASVVPVPDAETATLMGALHEGLVAGLPPAVALARAQAWLAGAGPVAAATAAGFVCVGAGYVPVPARPASGRTTSTAGAAGGAHP
ncbi:CHAT domain-containing tetratricopeptide repeat protein [Kineosporia sp. A_224]|uniref:CHAT domain-containing protein n=1 Tax=Kineosporia sp. A_224 TaxID=1962180 RepID=UPI000B4A92F2|nr:CHAT domain-containing tetratricopeptide repeat protein [Kineosporia sp. A_224]